MAYIVTRPNERHEIRESVLTPNGPRSRTLATFRELTPAVLDTVRARSAKPLGAAELRKLAVRSGVPVARGQSDQAAAELLQAVANGSELSDSMRRLLLDRLDGGEGDRLVTDAEQAAAQWLAEPPRARGEALRDLLLLADRLPVKDRGSLAFPPISTTRP